MLADFSRIFQKGKEPMNKSRSEKEPAHNLIPVLITCLDKKRDAARPVEAKKAFEIAIEQVCQAVMMMTIPKQHVPALTEALETLAKNITSQEVRSSLTDLVISLKST